MDTKSFAHKASRQQTSGAWSSRRLRYIKGDAQDTKQVETFAELWNSPDTQMRGSTSLMMPINVQEVRKALQESVESCLMCACVCLPDAEANENKNKAGLIIGNATLSPGIGPTMIANRRATLGITIAPEFQGQGYGREAIEWVLDWGFSQAGLHSIALSVSEFNAPAVGLYESIGFVREGRERQARWVDGKWHDVLLMSMLDDEWWAKRKAEELR